MEHKPPRILMTTDTVGGVWTFSIELARVLSGAGYTVWLAALGGSPSAGQELEAGSIPRLRLFGSQYKLEWMETPWEDVAASGRWLLEIARRFEPDLVHLNSFGHARLPWKCPTVLTAHSCVASWWRATKNTEAPAEWNRYRALVKEALTSATAVTAPSVSMATCLEREYNFEARRVEVVPNGRQAVRGLERPKESFVFAAGRLWDEGKNIASLAAVGPQLRWPVYLAGPVNQDEAFRGCLHLGALTGAEIRRWLQRASIYALPARYEPFGLSVLEAAQAGCALVLGDIPSLRENWSGAAIFVPPDDRSALQKAMTDLINSPDWCSLMGFRARRRAASFSPERMGERYMALYQSVWERQLACAS